MGDIELCDTLDRLEYSIQGMCAAVSGVRKRIIDEWVNKIPFPTYGRPPTVMSKPLMPSQVAEMLTCYADNLQEDSEALCNIAKELNKKENVEDGISYNGFCNRPSNSLRRNGASSSGGY